MFPANCSAFLLEDVQILSKRTFVPSLVLNAYYIEVFINCYCIIIQCVYIIVAVCFGVESEGLSIYYLYKYLGVRNTIMISYDFNS